LKLLLVGKIASPAWKKRAVEVRLLDEEKEMSRTGLAKTGNSANALLGLAFRESWNALLVHVMSQLGTKKATNYN
jgi:hypothetical protein